MMLADKRRVVMSRRGFLAAAAGAGLLLNHPLTFGQLIENSPSSGQGWTPPGPYGPETVISAPSPAPDVRAGRVADPAKDWRAYLLSGERSIVMGRDGPARRIRYCTSDGLMDASGYEAACHLLRDVQANRMAMMDPRLLDVLCGIQRWMEYNGRSCNIEVTSGFRTLQTNVSTEGAARNSMHLYGKAADIVIPGASSALVGAMVRQFNSNGGTGIYLARGFVHVDTGAARTWVSSAPRTRRS
jgi:uncharacterized protein YcbK (DUF882 family)